MAARQHSLPLFEPALPDGLAYHAAFLTVEEEQRLLAHVRACAFEAVTMHGVVARRRVAHFGVRYDYASRTHAPGEPRPDWLRPLRRRVAELTGHPAEAWGEILVTEYPPGAAIGWHHDAPGFGVIAGVSLGSSCRLRLRRGLAGAREIRELAVEPRSLYVLDGEARRTWQHSIPAVEALRWSITLRTIRRR